jgi:thiamine kinase-like enzyme
MYLCANRATKSSVLVRLFGTGDFFNRHQENSLFAELAAAGLGAPLLGVFSRGRVEGIVPGLPLNYRVLHERRIYTQVARALAQLHCFAPSEDALPRNKAAISHWQFCEKLLNKAKELGCLPDEEICNGAPTHLATELQALRRHLSADDIVFCHNDLLGANMLHDVETSTIRFVDFEYAGYAPRAYDLGNHFNEWMGLTENGYLLVSDPLARYPTPTEQRGFVEAYIRAWVSASITNGWAESPQNSMSQETTPTALSADRLVSEANAFSLLSHWIWSVWAFVMASDPPTESFDYVRFARERLRLMRAHWHERLYPLLQCAE